MEFLANAAFASGTVTVMVAVLGAALAYRNSRRLQEHDKQLQRVNAQLEELYGPMLALTFVSARNFGVAIEYAARDEKCHPSDDGKPEMELDIWEDWVRAVFMPANRQMMTVIATKAHLIIDGETFPECLLDFGAHVAGYEAIVRRWDRGDYSKVFSPLRHPDTALHQYLDKSFRHLRNRQAELLQSHRKGTAGKYRFRPSRPAISLF